LVFLCFTTIGILYQSRFNPNFILTHIAAILTISFAVHLGFCDDVFDLKWRHKLWMPAIASLPILVVYSGVTYIVIPIILRPYLGETLEIGIFYYLYMIALTIFCMNSINIHAGINGLESGQSIIIASSIMLYNSIEMFL